MKIICGLTASAAEMGTLVAGVMLAVGAEILIRSLKHLHHGTAFSPVTFFGGVCFIAAIANYVNKPTFM